MVTLQELLSRTALQNADVFYNAATVGGLPICGADDTQTRRLLVDPNRTNVYFPQVADVSPNTNFLNIDDGLYRQILTATGGFRYQLSDERGRPLPGTGILHLCRDQAPTAGRYAVYVTDNAILNNAPRQPNLMDQLVGIHLSDAEVIGLVRGSGMLDASQYAVSQDPAGLFFVAHNRTLVSNLANWMENDAVARAIFTDPARRSAIARALRANTEADDFQFMGIRWGATWQPILAIAGLLGIPVSVVATYYIQKHLMERMQSEGTTFDLNKVMRDRTAELRTSDPKSIDVRGQDRYIREIRSGLNRSGYPHVLISGPSGSGKTHGVETVARLLINGVLETRLPSGIRYVQVDAGKIVTEAGTWQNGAKTVFGRVLDSLGSEPTIVHLLESDRFANAGSDGNSRVNLLPELYSIMEQKTPRDAKLFFILDSTRYQTIYEAAPDLARRTHFVEVIPQTPDIIRNAMDVGIAMRLRDDKPGVRPRFERIRFSPAALDAIAALGEYKDGAPPSSHLALLDAIAEEAETARPTGNIMIEAEHVFRMVARDTRRTTQAVQVQYQRRMASGRFEGNRIIQEALLEGFYRAYPEPRGGMLNPLDLPAEAANAKATIFDGEPVTRVNPPQPPAAPAANPNAELLTYPVNDTAIEAALRRVDPALADYYRANISNAATPVSLLGEILQRLDGNALRQASQALRAEGLFPHEHPERLIFEAVTRAAAARGGWTPSSPTELPARMAAFETEVRRDRGVERRAADPADAARREAEERARREAETRGRP